MCMESQTTMRNNWIDKSTNHGIIFPQITELFSRESRNYYPTNHGKIIYILRNLYKKLCKLVDYLYTCTHKIIRYRSDGL